MRQRRTLSGTVAVSYYDYRFNDVDSNDGLETAHWIRRSYERLRGDDAEAGPASE